MRKTMISLAILLAVVVTAPAFAGPTYWDFSGPITLNTTGVPGGTLIGRFWGDPDSNELWELRWWTNVSGNLASPLYLQTDFSGYTVSAVDPDYIVAIRISPVDVITFDPLPGGNYYSQTIPSGLLKANPLQFATSAAPPPIPAPGALLLGGLGMGMVGWLRRRRTL